MKRSNNLTGIFHLAIIASFLLGLSGCGHKANPYYLEEAPKSDENIKFIIKKPGSDNSDNNESCNDKK